MTETTRQSEITEDIREMRKLFHILPISYNGSKQGNFEWVASVLSREAVGCKMAIDGFSGSGIITALLAQIGLNVYSADMLMSSYCLTTTLAENPGQTIDDDAMDHIASHRCVSGMVYEPSEDKWVGGLDNVADQYNGTLTPNEAVWLEWTKRKLADLDAYQTLLGYSALRAIMCIQPFGTPNGRNTLAHRIKQLERYGHNKCLGNYLNSSHEIEVVKWFRKYVEKFNSATTKLSSMRKGEAICRRMDIAKLLEETYGQIDFAYFDPPYGGNGTRTYDKDYRHHERLLGAGGIDGLDFETPSKYAKSFDILMDLCDGIDVIVFSYNSKAWANIDEIAHRIKRHGYSVDVESRDHTHGKKPIPECQNEVVENLIIARRKGA